MGLPPFIHSPKRQMSILKPSLKKILREEFPSLQNLHSGFPRTLLVSGTVRDEDFCNLPFCDAAIEPCCGEDTREP